MTCYRIDPLGDCILIFWYFFIRSILVVLGIASDSLSSSQAQTSQSQAGDTGNSEKEAVTEKSKESSAC